MIDDAIFITGAQRSGTTLLEKLVGELRGVSILSQPFPALFLEAKRAFLRSRGSHDLRYPLGHLFLDSPNERASFDEYLAHWRTSPAELAAVFEQMRGYSGQYTTFTDEQLQRAFATISANDDFAAVVATLNRTLGAKEHAAFFGSKETTCEQFIPFLLARGFRCTLIVRDPRDVLASLNHGRGHDFAGSPKPTLFNVRSWRKSVAYAMAHEERDRFAWCRYEDLVADPEGVIARMTARLNLPGAPSSQLRDWRGNSSHRELQGISTAPVGGYKDVLPESARLLVEASCLPELKALGYETSLTSERAAEILRQMTEPYAITRTGMDADTANRDNAEREVERLRRVAEESSSDSESWFLFESVHARLREAMSR